MRIGLFTNNYLPFCGGVTISVQTLRRGLEGRGHEAWIFAPRFPGVPDPDPRVVRFPSIPAATYPEFALAVPWSPRIGRLVGRLDLDVFHAHHPFLLGPAARRLARRRERALVFTYHTRYEKYAHYVPLTRPLVEAAALHLSTRFAASADAVIAPSTLVRDQLRARGVSAPITVVPTGVDLARFRPGSRDAARHALGLPPAVPVVLYVGRLDREKSVDRVLLAFDRVAGTLGGRTCGWSGKARRPSRCGAWPPGSPPATASTSPGCARTTASPRGTRPPTCFSSPRRRRRRDWSWRRPQPAACRRWR